MIRDSTHHQAHDRDRSHYRMMVTASWLHYMQGLTQAKVAEQMRLSRASVNRLVQAAQEAGIVKFRLEVDEALFPELDQKLRDRYDLLDAVVVLSAEDRDARNLAIAQGAAEWLKPRLKPDMVIGIGTGRTIAHLPSAMAFNQKVPCTFCDIIGTVIDSEGSPRFTVTSRMAEVTGGTAIQVIAPVSVMNSSVRDALLKEPSIAETLGRAEQSDIVIQGVGAVHASNGLAEGGYLSPEQLDDLQSSGAIGETMGQFFDREGLPIEGPLDERIISLTIDSLKNIPWRVCLAGGIEKVHAIDAALRGAIFNLLVTDYQTARKLTE